MCFENPDIDCVLFPAWHVHYHLVLVVSRSLTNHIDQKKDSLCIFVVSRQTKEPVADPNECVDNPTKYDWRLTNDEKALLKFRNEEREKRNRLRPKMSLNYVINFCKI